MNRHVRALGPRLFELAYQSKHASLSVEASSTLFTKKACMVNLDGINHLLVTEAVKLGSAVLQSISAATDEERLTRKKSDKLADTGDNSHTKKSGLDLKKGLMTGAALSAAPLLAANYTIDKANDSLDARMMAIPGLAAATVGAILAAKSMGSSVPDSNEVSKTPSSLVSELHSALAAKEVVDQAISGDSDPELKEDLQKMSAISTDHIASLITEILL